LFSSSLFLSKKYLIYFLFFLFIIYTIPWSKQSIKRLTQQNLFSKALIDSKTIFQTAQEENWRIIVSPNSEEFLTNHVYYFYKQSLIWYSQFYPSVEISFFENHQDACQKFQQSQENVLFSLSGVIDCPANINLKKQQFHGSLAGFHHEN